MRKNKHVRLLFATLFFLVAVCMICGFTTSAEETGSGKQRVSSLVSNGEGKQEVAGLATTTISGCNYYVKSAVQNYYSNQGYSINKSYSSSDNNSVSSYYSTYYTFKCSNDEMAFPEYRRVTATYIGTSTTQQQGLCNNGATCTTQIYSKIALNQKGIVGCNATVRKAVEDYYISKGVYVVANTASSDYNDFASGSKYSFKCSNDGAMFSNYKQVMAQYVGTSATQTQGVCNAGATCHTTIWTNADLGLDDVSIDLDEGRLVVSGVMHDDKDAWNIVYDNIQQIIVGITGLGILICLLAFVLQFIRLGATAGNPAERERILKGIIWTGIGTVGCGAVTLVFSFAFNLI